MDYADVRYVLDVEGVGCFGYGEVKGQGEDRAQHAARQAMSELALCSGGSLDACQSILVTITTALYDISIGEFATVGNVVSEALNPSCRKVVAHCFEPDAQNFSVSVVAKFGMDEAV